MSKPNSVDSAPAMDAVDTTTPGPFPTLLTNRHRSLAPGIEKHDSAQFLNMPSAQAADITLTTGKIIDFASAEAPTVPSPFPNSETHQKPHHTFQAMNQTVSTSPPTRTAFQTPGFKQWEAPEEPNTASAATEPFLPPSHQDIKEHEPLKQGCQTQYVHPDNDEETVPETEKGEEETGPNARVWRTYLIESQAYDDNMVEEARGSLDGLLIFAGLFSGVITSFAVQTSQSLQQASADVSASLLFELIAVQRAATDGTPVSSVPSSSLNPNSKFVPKTLDVWVNGLFFVSLALNLVVALGAVLVKQWLDRYVARRSGTAKKQSHMRQYRFDGFEQWKVLAITGWLPVIMHFSLAVFSIGLILFLNPLQAVLSWILAALAGGVYMLYLVTNFLPTLFPHCPYQSPLSDFLRPFLQPFFQKFKDASQDTLMDDVVSVKALDWLFNASFNPSTHSITRQALCSLPMIALDKVRSVYETCRLLRLACTRSPSVKHEYHTIPGMESAVERLVLSYFAMWQPGLDHASQRSFTELGRISFTAQSNDPCYMITSLAFNSMDTGGYPRAPWTPSASECLQAILSYSDVSLHPVVWMTIIRNSVRLGVFSAEEPYLVKLLLPILIWNTDDVQVYDVHALSLDASGRYSMTETITQCMRDEFWNLLTKGNLLNKDFSIHRTQSEAFTEATPASRALMVTMETALHQISRERYLHDNHDAHWENIGHVLRQFRTDCNADKSEMGNDSAVLVLFFHHFVECLLEQIIIQIGRHPLETEVFLNRWQLVLDVYFSTRAGYRMTQSTSSPSHGRLHAFFQRIERLLPCHSKQLSRHTNASSIRQLPKTDLAALCRAIDWSLCDIPNSTVDPMIAYPPVLQTMSLALQADCATAYDIVVQFKCLNLLHGYDSSNHDPWQDRCPRIHLGQQFITGLVDHVVHGRAKMRCMEYLITNLRKFIILWITESICDSPLDRQKSVEFPIKELAGLLPRQDLESLHPWLTAVLKWLEENQTPDAFDRLKLGDDSMQEFLVTALKCLPYYQDKYLQLIPNTMKIVIKALTEAENTTEPEPVSMTYTDAVPSLQLDTDGGKLSRTIQTMLRWWGVAQAASSDLELQSSAV